MSAKQVLLIHGLAETSLRMLPLAFALKMEGFKPVFFDYPSTLLPIESLCENNLGKAITSFHGNDFHVVAHSMGAVMMRYYLEHYNAPNLKRIVMLTPGNHGSAMLTHYTDTPIANFLGPSGMQSRDDDHCFSCELSEKIPVETGIIAGGLPLDPTSLFAMPWPHDGMVTVGSTRLENMKDHITLLTSHDAVTFDPIAIHQTIRFLKSGQFNH